MAPDLIRDSPFGHIVRLLTRNKVFPYPEERDPSLWKKYVHKEKSAHMAHHGSVEPPEDADADELKDLRGVRTRDDSEETVAEGYNEASGARVDPEKGRDKHVVDWYVNSTQAPHHVYPPPRKVTISRLIVCLTLAM